MLLLVLAYGHVVGVVDEDVHCHEGGVGEEAGVNAGVVALVADDFLFDFIAVGVDAESLARLVFEGCRAHKFADAYMHVHEQVHLRNLRYVALHIKDVLFRVETCGKVFRKYLLHAFVEGLRVRVGGQGVEVGDEIAAVEVVLHPDEFLESAIIVAEMEVAGGADTAQHHFLASVGAEIAILFCCRSCLF